MGRHNILFLLGCFPLVASVAGFGQVEAPWVQRAIQSLRDQQARLQNVSVHYCFLYWTTNVDNLNLSLLKDVNYHDIVTHMANEEESEIPLEPEMIACCLYRRKGQKAFMEIESVFSSIMLKSKIILTFDGQSGFQLERERNGAETNRMEFLAPAEYYLRRQVYPDPSILCSQAILFSERYHYVDMVDRQGVYAQRLGDGLVLTSTFVFAGDGTGHVLDAQAGERASRYCRIEVEAQTLLPRIIEQGRVASLESYRMEIEEYFVQRGAHYPQRGFMKFSRNGRTSKVIYFIVDAETSDLNASLKDEQFVRPSDR